MCCLPIAGGVHVQCTYSNPYIGVKLIDLAIQLSDFPDNDSSNFPPILNWKVQVFFFKVMIQVSFPHVETTVFSHQEFIN